jgi:hypothetical protein
MHSKWTCETFSFLTFWSTQASHNPHMSSEIIIQIIACEKYEGFQHLNFDIFSQKNHFNILMHYLVMKLTLG